MNLFESAKELRIKQRNDLLRRIESIRVKLGDSLTKGITDNQSLTIELANAYIELYDFDNLQFR